MRVEIAHLRDGLEHIDERPRADAPEVGLELGEGHFDAIAVRAVRRKEEEPASGVPYCLCRGSVLVGGEVVQNDHGAGGQFRDQHLLDLCRECQAIHRTLDDPGRDHGIGGEACDERLRAP